MRTRSAALALLIAAPLLAACDDDPAGPDYPSLTGSYATEWSFLFDAGDFGSFSAACSGTLTITEQSGGEFSGSYTNTADDESCEAASGTIEGEVRRDGGIDILLDAQGTDEELEAITGCDVVSADNLLNGTVTNGIIDASADAVLDCPTQFGVLRVALELDVLAARI